MLAARSPAMRQIWRVISTVEVLPLVPVTATIWSGTGVKKRAASVAKARRGSRVGDVDGAFDLCFGPRDEWQPRRFDRRGNEILAIDLRALKRPEDSSGSDLAIVDRKTCHLASPAHARPAASRAWPASLVRLRDQRRVGNVDIARVVGAHADQRADARDQTADDRRRIPGGGALIGLDASVPRGSSSMAITT